MRQTAAALCLLALLPATPRAAAGAEDGISEFTLENGLRGVVIEDHRAPVVTQMVWYRVGAADSPPGQSGIAHFLEHLMFKATDTLADGEFSRIVAENGGDENAFTTPDTTAYFQRIAADRLDLMMGMEADRMTGLAPGAEGVLAERDVVMEERRQVVESSPDGPFFEARNAALYLNHPYRNPVIGWPQEIAAYDAEKAMGFYRAHYAPNNAILVVAGDVTPEAVEAMARKHFGPLPANPAIAPRSRPQEPPPIAARRVAFDDPRVSTPLISRLYLAPNRRPGDQAMAAACEVMTELLGGSGITSVMGRALELGDGIAVEAGASYSSTSLDPRSISLWVAPKPGIPLETAEEALDALLASFIAEGPDPASLERTRKRIRAAEIYELDSQNARANRFGSALASGLTLEDVEAWPGLLQAVTAEDVQACARMVFRPEASVTALMTRTPAPEVTQ